jgi:glyoxylase-like metal-dependent hydrolase (beta-lactamase superfamily II)
MRVHHLNCISTCPPAGKWMDGRSGLFERGRLACHCLLLESGDGLVLVDTGLGLGDVLDPEQRLSSFFLRMLKPEFQAEMTAVRQIERLGFSASDVRDIVLTHLDFDHAGGLDDFPRARVHLLAAERDHALAQKTWLDRQRFRPQQWSTRNRWVTYEPGEGDHWLGLACVRQLSGLTSDILLIPLAGHTHGHTGVAIRADDGWRLHAGDAFFDPREVDVHPRCRLGLRLYQRMMDTDRAQRVQNQARLRALHQAFPEITMFCSHDRETFERLSGRSADIPAEAFVHAAGDPYHDKIVRRPKVTPAVLSPHEPVPGIEVHDHELDDTFDFDNIAAPRVDESRPRS